MAAWNELQPLGLGQDVFESLYSQVLNEKGSQFKPKVQARHAAYYLTLVAGYSDEVRDHIALEDRQITLAADRICSILDKDLIDLLGRPESPTSLPKVNELVARVAISMGLATRFYVFRSRVDAGYLWLRVGLTAARLLNDRLWESNFLGDIGLWHKERGQLQEALAYYRQEMSISRLQNNASHLAAIHNNMGTAYLSTALPEQALEHFEQALGYYDGIDNPPDMAATLGNLSLALLDLERPDEALAVCERALSIQQKADDSIGIATTLNNMGLIHSAHGRYEPALQAHKRALEIRESLGNQQEMGITLSNISAIYWALGDARVAIEYLIRALGIFRSIRAHSYVVALTHNLAILYHDTARLNEAIVELRRAIGLADEINLAHDASNTSIDMLKQDLDQWEQELFYQTIPRVYGNTGEIIADFLLSPDWQAAHTYLMTYAVPLLNEETTTVFAELSEQYASNSSLIEQLTLHRGLLDDVCSYGMDLAFQLIMGEIDDEAALTQLIIEFVQTENWNTAQTYVQGHMALLEKDIEAMFEKIIHFLQGEGDSEGSVEKFKRHWDALMACRSGANMEDVFHALKSR